MDRPALFLDRDGVLIENRDDYVRSWADVEIFPQAIAALAGVRHCDYDVIVVTNQSAVGRGLITVEAAEVISDRLTAHIREAGGRVDALYMCPHGPNDGCDCRKPLPGLLHRAAREMSLDLEGSVMIGDALTDVQAGRAAGVGRLILVRTGRGRRQEALLSPAEREAIEIVDSLSDAFMSLGILGPDVRRDDDD